ncbi:hypothetical protein N7456_001743 [Penicillium angulare]|uniref:Cytochrome P450 n=1 Tax=Penicillium angulare TaxID=116970 RepID=A0A9W9G734_9EURO|nr:hypothetical protein N7456_001743 [Penicillium angulare]
MFFVLAATIIIFLVIFYAGVIFRGSKWQRPPLPPGPPGKPFIGNLWDLSSPDKQDWEHFFNLKERYGPICYMNIAGQPLVMLNDGRLALQLLEKRSSIHSSRPAHPFLDIAWNDQVSFSFQRNSISRGRTSLTKTFEGSKRISESYKKAGAIILKIVYGYTIEPHRPDPLVNLADQAMQGFSIAFSSTTWAVNFMPILGSLPAWFPGAGFIKLAQRFKTDALALADIPHDIVTQQMKDGTFSPSFLSEVLQKHPVKPGSKEETILKWSAGSMYAGGSDTTVSSISCFFLAMALFPEVQHKAQEEIDSVIGDDQLPQSEDRKPLPYIDAVVKEVLRWHPVLPVNVPHVSTQDDVCEGFFIPKGSWVMANIWGITHDPSNYDEPMSFKPERFLDSESVDGHSPAPDPHRLVFGFGRRACPGRILTDENIFLTVAQCLAVFNISKPVENGKVQKITAAFTSGLISHPMSYKLSILPRSENHRSLVEFLEIRYPWEDSHAELLASVSKA